MNILKSLLNPITQFSFDLRSSDRLKAYNAEQILSKTTGLVLNWKSLPHSQLLNVIANQFGFYSIYCNTSWSVYIHQLAETSKRINRAYQILVPTSLDWLEHEDRSSTRWYLYLGENNGGFLSRVDFLKKYLEIRRMEFNRCKLNNINFIGSNFDSSLTPKELASPGDLFEEIKRHEENTFFKSSMGWLYLFDSRLLYCNFLNYCFRNAIFHNVDFRYSVISSKELNGDIMGSDFSFCNNQYTDFSYCYAREAKFYKTNADYAMFEHTNLIGALFLSSSLKNACFVNARVHNVSFKGSNLQGADFTGASIRNVDCRGADLRYVKGLDISLVRIDQATLL
jgi:uncharacterized protein YjbI with pentapeptide repeats